MSLKISLKASSTLSRSSDAQDKKVKKLTLNKSRLTAKICQEDPAVPFIDPDNVIPVTPEHELPKKSFHSKLSKINSCSKILKKSKLNSLLQEKEGRNGSSTNITTASPKINLSLISPIQKTVNSSRKLSLKKPSKRRCSYSPTENGVKKKEKILKTETPNTQDPEVDNLSGLYTQSGSVSEADKRRIVSQLTQVKNKKFETSIDISNDSFNDVLTDSVLLDSDVKKKDHMAEGEFDIGDSILEDTPDSVQQQQQQQKQQQEQTRLKSSDEGLFMWIVTDVQLREYGSAGQQEKLLSLKQIKNEEFNASCHLRDDWCRMEVDVDDVLHVSNLDKTKTSCVIDNKSAHYVTIFPNTLISGTTIAAGITCERQAVLNEQFKTEFQNEAMVVGTITHDLFDWALQNLDCNEKQLKERLEEMLQKPKYVEILYQLNLDIGHVREKLVEYISRIKHWPSQYLQQQKRENTTESNNIHRDYDITKIVDIEENIWSPYYGFKGKIDVSVEVTIHRKPHLNSRKGNKAIMPLELKTGRMMSNLGSVEHRAQVAVYCILMSERYNTPIDSGLLYYVKTNHMQNIPLFDQERRALLIKRNEIARKLTLEKNRPTTLPDLLRRYRTCKNCSQNHTCMLLHKAREGGIASTSGVGELFDELTSHLRPPDLKYFSKWYELSLLEARHDTRHNKEKFIWIKSPMERESRGVCFSGMVLTCTDTTSDGKIHCTFERKSDHFNGNSPLDAIPVVSGDRVIISQENQRVFNQTTGYIKDVDSSRVIVSLQHRLKHINEIVNNTNAARRHQDSIVYRIDKDDTLSNYATPLSNISKLFQTNSTCDEKLRQSIIHDKAPEFVNVTTGSPCSPDKLYDQLQQTSKLNEVQRTAVRRCLEAKDYLMILGMPGAGKSTTIAVIVRTLVAAGKSVLLSSYTHSAVDTILMKLLQDGFTSFTRLGQVYRVHEKIRPYTAVENTKHFKTIKHYTDYYNSKSVFATTCLGVNHSALSKKRFDYCIVDEASQITQPVCIGAIRLANVFVLVGDHNQLPPLVQSPEAREQGMDVSLFKELSAAHPEAVVTLNVQYRMNESIMSLANSLVYNNSMTCGNSSMTDSCLDLPKYREMTSQLGSDIVEIIKPNRPVVFVDTDSCGFKEELNGKKLMNKGEAQSVKRIVESLLICGLHARHIGVICPYRNQLKILKESVDNREVEIETIDKYQGKDKECIIVTFVRSNDQCEVGELLRDWRRVNVALTRSKRKLILIGSKKTIVTSDILKNLVDIVDKNNWVVNLRPTNIV